MHWGWGEVDAAENNQENSRWGLQTPFIPDLLLEWNGKQEQEQSH